ncbi:MAG: flagellar biosynthetic protein FliP, partial [Pseudomonadota bacterium]|nr:flagellar biosynthetic protein FliP [Pseudomonadota bacterium]
MGAFFVLAVPEALAQTLTLDLGAGESGSFTGRILQVVALMTILSLAPSILITMTSFTRIIVVLSLVRSALGVQQTPPNMVLISLALFMTFFIMAPVFEQSWTDGIRPLMGDFLIHE